MSDKQNTGTIASILDQSLNNATKVNQEDYFYSYIPGAYGKEKLSIDEIGRTVKCMRLFPSYKNAYYDDVFHHSPQGIYAQRWDADEENDGKIEMVFDFTHGNKNQDSSEALNTVIGNFIIEGVIYNNEAQFPSILALLHDAELSKESSYAGFQPAKKIARLHQMSISDIILTAKEDEFFWQLYLKKASLYVIVSNSDYSKWFLVNYNIDTGECLSKTPLPDTQQAQPKLPVCIVDIFDSLYIAIPNSTDRVIVVPAENSPLGDKPFSFCPYNDKVIDYGGPQGGLAIIDYSPLLEISYGYNGLHYTFPKYTGLLRVSDRIYFEKRIIYMSNSPLNPLPVNYYFIPNRKVLTIENPYDNRDLKYTYALINAKEPETAESAYTSSGVLFWNNSQYSPASPKYVSHDALDLKKDVSLIPYYLCHFADTDSEYNYPPYALFEVIYPLPSADSDTNLDEIFIDVDGAILDRTGRLYVRGPTALNTRLFETPVLTSHKPLPMLVKAPFIPIKKGILPYSGGDFPTAGGVAPFMVWGDWLGWPHHIMPVSITLPDSVTTSRKPGENTFPRQAHLRHGSVLDVGQGAEATWGLYGNDGYGVFNDWPNIHFQWNDYLLPEDGYYSFPVLCLPYAGGEDGYGSGLEASISGFNVLFMKDRQSNLPYYPSHIYWPREKDYRVVFTPKFYIGTTFSFHDGSLPEGVTFSEDGVLSGKTSDKILSTYSFSVDVTNSEYGQPNGNSGTIFITIVGAEEPIMVPERLTNQPRINESYSHTFKSNPTAQVYQLAPNHDLIPDGLKFFSDTGVLSGTISGDAQAYTFAIEASVDGICWGPAQSYTLTVLPALVPDVYDQSIDIKVGALYEGVQIETSEQADAFVLEANTAQGVTLPGDGIPLGFTINLDNGTINGKITPNSVKEGLYQFSVAAQNGNGLGRFGKISLTIQEQAPPLMVPAVLPKAYPGEDYLFMFTINNAFTGIKFDAEVSQEELQPAENEYRVPKGLRLSESGNNVISGTIDKNVIPGKYFFLVQAYVLIDGSQAVGSPQEYVLEVLPSRFPEVISTEPLDFSKGEFASYQLQASNSGTKFIQTEGLLPEGITLSLFGLLSGVTSADVGIYNISVKSENDRLGYGPEKALVINIHESQLVSMEPGYIPNEILIVEKQCTYYFSAVGNPLSYQFSEDTHSSITPGQNVYPAGLTPTQQTVGSQLKQLLSGSPTSDVKTGDYLISIQAINGSQNPGDPQTYTLPVIGYPVWTGNNLTHTAALYDEVQIMINISSEDAAEALESQKEYADLVVEWAGAGASTTSGVPDTYPLGLQLNIIDGIWVIEGAIDEFCQSGDYKFKLVASNKATRENNYSSPAGSGHNGVMSAEFHFIIT